MKKGNNIVTNQHLELSEFSTKGDDLNPYNVLVLLTTNIPCINTEKGARNTWERNIKLQNRFNVTTNMHTILSKYIRSSLQQVCL
jgi:hypothetical protein